MSSNYHKTVTCTVCGKTMRDNNLKRHTSTKHGNNESVRQRGEGRPFQTRALFEKEAGTNDVHNDRLMEDNSIEAWKPDSGKKKFILIPEAKHRQMMASMSSAATASKNRDVLQSIQKPEQREMLKRYHLTQKIMEDARRSSNADA